MNPLRYFKTRLYDNWSKTTRVMFYIALISLIIGVVGIVPWQSIFPPKPYVSAEKIVIPPLTDNFQEELSVINPSNLVYNNVVVKFELLGDYGMSPSIVSIEPKQHLILSEFKGLGTIDLNFVSIFDEDRIMYLKINNLKKWEKLDYIFRFKNTQGSQQKVKVSTLGHKEIEEFDFTPFFLYYIDKMINKKKCDIEQFPEGIKDKSKRINPCFGGLRGNHSGEMRDVISLNMWLHPEWNENEVNFIFDTGPEDSKNKLSIYRYDELLITEIVESNSYKHLFEEEINFKDDWNDLYFALDTINKIYILYLNNDIIFNYTFKELEFNIPDLYYHGINSNEDSEIRNFGNFRLDELYIWSVALSVEDINQLYSNGTGCFYGEPCFNGSSS